MYFKSIKIESSRYCLEYLPRKKICNSDEFVHRKDLTTGADIFHTMIAKKGDANEGGTDFAGQNYFFLPAIDIPLNVLMLFLMSFSRAHREN